MYKLLIGEKEESYIVQMKKWISKSLKEVEIVGIVSSGNEALSLVRELEPDILLVSVELFGVSGLEVLRSLRQTNNEMEVIVMSEYNYFEFVKESIHYHARDFLVRPLKNEDFLNVMRPLLETLESRRKEKELLSVQENKLEQYLEYVEFSFIYSFLFNSKNDIELKKYREILGLGKFGFAINVEIEHVNEECQANIEKQTRVLQQAIRRIIAEKKECVVGPRIGNRILVYVNENDDTSEKLSNIELGKRLVREIQEELNISIRVGVGRTGRIENLHESYEEALKALCYYEDKNVVYIADIEKKAVSHYDYIELETELLHSIKFGKEGTMELFCQLLDCIQELNMNAKKNKIMEILVLACHEVRKQSENEVENLDYVSLFYDTKGLTWNELEEWVYKKLEYILKSVRTSRSARKSDLVKIALLYINEHYQEDVTLDDVSDYVGVTPQHLSKVFKEETGYKYVDFLTNLRINKAKEYLLEGNRTIKEICYMVGLNDPNYFSRVFKKTVGKSPTEYVKSDQFDLAIAAK